MASLVRSKVLQIGYCCATKWNGSVFTSKTFNVSQTPTLLAAVPQQTRRWLNLSAPRCRSQEPVEGSTDNDIDNQEQSEDPDTQVPDPAKRKVVDVETSIRYLKSKAYHMTYGDVPVWMPYRRNYKGRTAPKSTRKTCIRKGEIATGNPCPICRDEYLVIHYTNTDLLNQFVSPATGELLTSNQTGVCQKQQKSLRITLQLAQDKGYLKMPFPVRLYNYKDHYPDLESKQQRQTDLS